jgi:hypothetical protein
MLNSLLNKDIKNILNNVVFSYFVNILLGVIYSHNL